MFRSAKNVPPFLKGYDRRLSRTRTGVFSTRIERNLIVTIFINIIPSNLNTTDFFQGYKMERHPDGFGGAVLPFALLSCHPGGGGGNAG